MTHTETHTGWLLLAPVYMADMESDAPVIIPRYCPECWLAINAWLGQVINVYLQLHDEGFMFYAVRELKEPNAIKV